MAGNFSAWPASERGVMQDSNAHGASIGRRRAAGIGRRPALGVVSGAFFGRPALRLGYACSAVVACLISIRQVQGQQSVADDVRLSAAPRSDRAVVRGAVVDPSGRGLAGYHVIAMAESRAAAVAGATRALPAEQVFREIDADSKSPTPVGPAIQSWAMGPSGERYARGPVYGADDVCLGRTVSDADGRFSMRLATLPPSIFVGAYGPLGGGRREIRDPSRKDEPVLLEISTRGVLAISVRFTGGPSDDPNAPSNPLTRESRPVDARIRPVGRLSVRVIDAAGFLVRAATLDPGFDDAGRLRLFACGLAPGPATVEVFIDGGEEPVARVPDVAIAADEVTTHRDLTPLDLDPLLRPVRLTFKDSAGLPFAGLDVRKVTPRRGSPEDRAGMTADRGTRAADAITTDPDGRVATFVANGGDSFAVEGEDCEPALVRGVVRNRDIVLTRRYVVGLEFSTPPAFDAVLREFAARPLGWTTVHSFAPADGPVVVTEHAGSLGVFRTSRAGTLTVRFQCVEIIGPAAPPEREFIGEPFEIPVAGTASESAYVPPPAADAIRRAAEALSARLRR